MEIGPIKQKLIDDVIEEEFNVISAMNAADNIERQNKILQKWHARKEALIVEAIEELGLPEGCPKLKEIEKVLTEALFPCRDILKG